MSKLMKDKIYAIEQYLNYFPKDYTAANNLKLCKYADELDIKLDEMACYPHMDSDYFIINAQIKAGKKYHLTNTKTNHQLNGIDTIVIWNEPCGRLAFVNREYYDAVIDEWDELMQIILSYNPLDWDSLNKTFIFDLKNGKKLIRDYPKIVAEFREKCKVRIKKYQILQKKKEVEKLIAELNEEGE